MSRSLGLISSALILGGNSEIGLAIARRFAEEGASVMIASRSPDPSAEVLSGDKPGRVTWHRFDVLDTEGHSTFLDTLDGLPDVVVCSIGLNGRQAELVVDPPAASRVMQTNYLAPALLLGEIANRMKLRGRGTIVGISSVAGDRGRRSNYIYGSAKAGFTAFLSGLRASLSDAAVRVITIKPGFVGTRATLAMNPPRILTASPEEVADAVLNALRGGRNVIYVRAVWRPIMTLIRLLPEPLFKRLRV